MSDGRIILPGGRLILPSGQGSQAGSADACCTSHPPSYDIILAGVNTGPCCQYSMVGGYGGPHYAIQITAPDINGRHTLPFQSADEIDGLVWEFYVGALTNAIESDAYFLGNYLPDDWADYCGQGEVTYTDLHMQVRISGYYWEALVGTLWPPSPDDTMWGCVGVYGYACGIAGMQPPYDSAPNWIHSWCGVAASWSAGGGSIASPWAILADGDLGVAPTE